MRMLYRRLLSKCSELCRSFGTVSYCSYSWTNYERLHFLRSKLLITTYKILAVSNRVSFVWFIDKKHEDGIAHSWQRSRNFYLSNMSSLNVSHESTVSDHSKTGFIFDIASLLKK